MFNVHRVFGPYICEIYISIVLPFSEFRLALGALQRLINKKYFENFTILYKMFSEIDNCFLGYCKGCHPSNFGNLVPWRISASQDTSITWRFSSRTVIILISGFVEISYVFGIKIINLISEPINCVQTTKACQYINWLFSVIDFIGSLQKNKRRLL